MKLVRCNPTIAHTHTKKAHTRKCAHKYYYTGMPELVNACKAERNVGKHKMEQALVCVAVIESNSMHAVYNRRAHNNKHRA